MIQITLYTDKAVTGQELLDALKTFFLELTTHNQLTQAAREVAQAEVYNATLSLQDYGIVEGGDHTKG